MKKTLLFIWFSACAALLLSSTVSAYIDPSAMTYIIQIIAGVAIAAGAGIGFYMRRIKRAFSKFKKDSGGNDSWDYDYDDDDDDETGYGDYDLPVDNNTDSITDTVAEPEPQPVLKKEPAAAPSITVEPSYDIYDETGGESGLEAENRELRRLLAIEREKVEILIKALNICTDRDS